MKGARALLSVLSLNAGAVTCWPNPELPESMESPEN